MKIGITKLICDIDCADCDKVELVKKRMQCLFLTSEGTLPGDRAFGLDNSYQDEAADVSEASFCLEVYQKVEEYIPQVEVTDIEFEYVDDVLIPTIHFEFNQEQEEEEEEEEE